MPWPQVFVLIFLIAVNAFFVMAELAIISSRRGRLQKLVSDGTRGAESALALHEDPGKFLSSVQIGITLVAILSGAYSESALSPPLADLLRELGFLASYAQTIASSIVVVSVVYFSLVIGELVPKRLALANPEKLACFAAPTMMWLAFVFTPFTALLRRSTDRILRMFITPGSQSSDITDEEVKTLIAEGTEAGVFEKAEQELIEGVLRVADRTVRSIMVPRPDIVWLDISQSDDLIYEQIAKSGHSRFLVSRGGVDETIGMVQAKTLLEQLHSRGKIDLKAALKTPLYVHESTNVLKLLDMFKSSVVHMAIVLDEHGTVQGIVTPTDILTGIAGELPSEEDVEEPSAVRRHDGSWLLDATMPVFEVERVLDVEGLGTADAEYTTLAGFVLAQLGRIPERGESFVWKNWRFEVVDLDNRRIDQVMVSYVETPSNLLQIAKR